MSKRRAAVQLTQDNFGEENNDEAPDGFSRPLGKAPVDALKERKIISAKRRISRDAAAPFKALSSLSETSSQPLPTSGFSSNFSFGQGANNNSNNQDAPAKPSFGSLLGSAFSQEKNNSPGLAGFSFGTSNSSVPALSKPKPDNSSSSPIKPAIVSTAPLFGNGVTFEASKTGGFSFGSSANTTAVSDNVSKPNFASFGSGTESKADSEKPISTFTFGASQSKTMFDTSASSKSTFGSSAIGSKKPCEPQVANDSPPKSIFGSTMSTIAELSDKQIEASIRAVAKNDILKKSDSSSCETNESKVKFFRCVADLKCSFTESITSSKVFSNSTIPCLEYVIYMYLLKRELETGKVIPCDDIKDVTSALYASCLNFLDTKFGFSDVQSQKSDEANTEKTDAIPTNSSEKPSKVSEFPQAPSSLSNYLCQAAVEGKTEEKKTDKSLKSSSAGFSSFSEPESALRNPGTDKTSSAPNASVASSKSSPFTFAAPMLMSSASFSKPATDSTLPKSSSETEKPSSSLFSSGADTPSFGSQTVSTFGNKADTSSFGSQTGSTFGNKGGDTPSFSFQAASTFGGKADTPPFGSQTGSLFGNKTDAPSFGSQPGLSFGKKEEAPSFGSQTGSLFGNKSDTPAFGSSSSLSFGTGSITPSSGGLSKDYKFPTATFKSIENVPKENQEAEAEENDQPPKVEAVEHSEEGSVYSKKIKLYYKQDEKFVEKGLAFLHIIKKDNAKPQLLARSATTTGTILLNIHLNAALPIQIVEKGVMITCIPNPKIPGSDDTSLVTFLIRVKPADVKEVHDKLVENRAD